METTVRPAMYSNLHPIQGSIDANELGQERSYITGTLNASKDPFGSKTIKYAQGSVVLVQAIDKAIFGKWSKEAAIEDPTKTSDGEFYIPAGGERFFRVVGDYKYLRVIEDSASARVIVTEFGVE